jgi:hypothetical protein
MSAPFDPEPMIAARVTTPGAGMLVRTFRLTAYDVEMLAGDVRRLGRGARVELTIQGTPDDIAEVEQHFAWAAERAVELNVRCAATVDRLPRLRDEDVVPARPASPPPHARRPYDVGDVVYPNDLAEPFRVIAVECLRVPGGLLHFLTLEPTDGSAAGPRRRLVRLSHTVSREPGPGGGTDDGDLPALDAPRAAHHA